MGYWGYLLVARSQRSLSRLSEVRVFGQPEQEQDLVGDWKLLRVAGNEPPDLHTALEPIVAATGAPALLAFVLDSDCAVIRGRGPAGAQWGTVLNRELALSYDGVLEAYDTPDHGLAGAMRWAGEAGLRLPESAVNDALHAKGTVVEEVLDRLLVTFGILKMPN
jgi:hypothetical protein